MHIPEPHSATFDAIIIGGSYAGLSAATQLARARRRVLVIDGGQRRNRYASHSHGFLTQDGSGRPPSPPKARRNCWRMPPCPGSMARPCRRRPAPMTMATT